MVRCSEYFVRDDSDDSDEELGRGSSAKAGGSRSLELGAPPEAGFTEQRSPPAPGSGRIAGRCYLGPLRLNELAQ
ncbi:hypothetical protein Q3G72_016597 [Acer saccharum]|nr:hypothetical protein Q3G72_016597 [Acer saccharum]